MLCVRDGAFRVEYRVVLLDEKPCCAGGCDVYLGYLEVPGQSPPPFVACPTCAFHNKLTEERCSACGMGLFE